jgi:hypothetical protein
VPKLLATSVIGCLLFVTACGESNAGSTSTTTDQQSIADCLRDNGVEVPTAPGGNGFSPPPGGAMPSPPAGMRPPRGQRGLPGDSQLRDALEECGATGPGSAP